MKYKITFTAKCHIWVDAKDYGETEVSLEEALKAERENAAEYIADAVSQGDAEIEVVGQEGST